MDGENTEGGRRSGWRRSSGEGGQKGSRVTSDVNASRIENDVIEIDARQTERETALPRAILAKGRARFQVFIDPVRRAAKHALRGLAQVGRMRSAVVSP
jgi:hypothetical protein